VVGFTTGSRGEVPGKKENLWQEIIIIIITSKQYLFCFSHGEGST
jgi:hypothetical protein